jgi:glycosyltransferase involved in cell wall biosynthesis
MIEHGHNGLLVSAKDERAFHAALEQLVVNAAQREDLGRRARETVEAHFAVDRVAAAYAALYMELLDAKG